MSLSDFLQRHFDLSPVQPTPRGVQIHQDEMAANDMIPYTHHFDDCTLLTRDDGVMQVIKIDGLLFESYSDAQRKAFTRGRNTVLRSIANSDMAVYVHTIRRRSMQYPAGEGKTWFARHFNQAWRQRYERNAFFVNDIYITLVRNRFRQGAPGWIDRVVSLFSSDSVSQADLETYEKQVQDVNDAAMLILKALGEYGARRLQIQRRPAYRSEQVDAEQARADVERFRFSWHDFVAAHGKQETYPAEQVLDYLGEDFSEIGGFLHYLVNLEEARVLVSDLPLHDTLSVSEHKFKVLTDRMVVENRTGARAAAVMSMGEWPRRTPSRMMDEFLRQPVEFIMTQSFFYTDRITAEHDMRQERRRLAVNDREGAAEEDQAEIIKGLQDLMRGKEVNGLHHLSILIHVPVVQDKATPADNSKATLDRLAEQVGFIQKAFIPMGVKAIREKVLLETFFWSQLPGQAQHLIGRRGKIKSSNFAGFASLHNFATGKIDGNLWGPAIMPFETESGTAYQMNFHREVEGMVAGHVSVTADTGAGKTTILSALMTMVDKADPRVFWFDNREGAKTWIYAMGGQHTALSVHRATGWNPFQLPDTAENRAYLVELLGMMRTCYGGQLVPDDIRRFQRMVEENYHLSQNERRLRNLVWCLGEGPLAADMEVWHGARGKIGANAGVFDNEHDSIDLAQCRHHCFEMRELIKDGVARPELAVVLSYPFHRIEQAMNGDPFIVVLEEGQNLVKHAFWRQKIDSYIMQIRRKNGLLAFVTPDAKYLYSETDSIRKQVVTQLFLPNDKASRKDLVDELGLTESEFEFIRDTPTKSFKFLIRRGRESIRAVFDLSSMPEFIPVLSSNDKGIALMERIMAELDTRDPEIWVPVFMKRALTENTHNLNKPGSQT